MMTKYVCPCTECPHCGYSDGALHPVDGLAYCGNCEHEWWAVIGSDPGQHMRSAEDEIRQREYDRAIANV